jgi:Ca2+-binding EF-hand superfamily protein
LYRYAEELTDTHFGQDFNKLFEHLDHDKTGMVDSENLRNCMFGDYMTVWLCSAS